METALVLREFKIKSRTITHDTKTPRGKASKSHTVRQMFNLQLNTKKTAQFMSQNDKELTKSLDTHTIYPFFYLKIITKAIKNHYKINYITKSII